jgi:hypothetical protein
MENLRRDCQIKGDTVRNAAIASQPNYLHAVLAPR